MPTAKLFNMAGDQVGEVALSEAVFGVEPNESVLHDSVKNHLANCRQGTQSALTKGEVSYSTAKPWRQKGTGRARAGYKGSPVWTHGGVAFAPKPRDYSYTLNKKVKRLARRVDHHLRRPRAADVPAAADVGREPGALRRAAATSAAVRIWSTAAPSV